VNQPASLQEQLAEELRNLKLSGGKSFAEFYYLLVPGPAHGTIRLAHVIFTVTVNRYENGEAKVTALAVVADVSPDTTNQLRSLRLALETDGQIVRSDEFKLYGPDDEFIAEWTSLEGEINQTSVLTLTSKES
jgi:hypothetical protein